MNRQCHKSFLQRTLNRSKIFLNLMIFFIKSYNKESRKGWSLEIDVQYPENLHDFHNDLHFLPERMKIEKVERLVANLHHKTEYAIYIRNLKQALNHRLVLNKNA